MPSLFLLYQNRLYYGCINYRNRRRAAHRAGCRHQFGYDSPNDKSLRLEGAQCARCCRRRRRDSPRHRRCNVGNRRCAHHRRTRSYERRHYQTYALRLFRRNACLRQVGRGKCARGGCQARVEDKCANGSASMGSVVVSGYSKSRGNSAVDVVRARRQGARVDAGRAFRDRRDVSHGSFSSVARAFRCEFRR